MGVFKEKDVLALGEDAKRHVSKWLKNPDLRVVLTKHRSVALEAIQPILYMLTDRGADSELALRAAGGPTREGGILLLDIEGSRTVGRFGEAMPEASEAERLTVARSVAAFADVVRKLADEAADAGVMLLRRDPADLFVLGQLLRIEPDWDHDPVLDLHVLPLGAVSLDGWSITWVSDAASVAGQAALNRIRASIRSGQPEYEGHRVRAPGRPPGSTSVMAAALQQALPEVIRDHPDATAPTLIREWREGKPETAGRLLRDLTDHKAGDPPPSDSTLRRRLDSARRRFSDSPIRQ